MAGFANFVSNAGLVGEGMDQGKQAENSLEMQRQEVEKGKMGLEDVTRNRATELTAQRAASSASGSGMQGSLQARINAYVQAGRTDLAAPLFQQLQKLIHTLEK